jgi:hypothetical protein
MDARLSPPPGAPDTRGAPTLVFDESPAIVATAARLAGSGPVSIIASEPGLARLALDAAALNRLPESPRLLPMGLPPWPRPAAKALEGAFGLIVVNHCAGLVVRAIKDLASWLDPAAGRLIVAGAAVGAQSALLVKAASRAGLSLMDTSMEGDWAVLAMARRRPARAAVWSWSPGDWLSELTEEDREALARIEALDKAGRKARRAGPTVFGGAGDDEEALEPLEGPEGLEGLEARGEA